MRFPYNFFRHLLNGCQTCLTSQERKKFVYLLKEYLKCNLMKIKKNL